MIDKPDFNKSISEILREFAERGEDVIALLNEFMSRSPLYRFIGLKILELKEGYVKASFPYKEELCRIGGLIHGGIIMTVIDYVAGLAVMTVNKGVNQATLELKVNFLKPLVKGPFIAIGQVIKVGKRTIVAEGKIYDGDNELGAVGLGTWYIVYDKYP